MWNRYMNPFSGGVVMLQATLGLVVGFFCALLSAQVSSAPLHIDVFRGNGDSFGVTSTVIYGKTEAMLIDAQFHNSQTAELADRIEARKLHLKAIFITHPDDDHYIGLAVLHERFPSAPIYMTSTALAEFNRTVASSLAAQNKYLPAETPDSVPTPQVLPSTKFLIDGQEVEIVEDLQGDYAEKQANSFVWIPSLRTVVAGDITFLGIHPWLSGSTEKTRSEWRKSLEKVSSLHPLVVVSGHKKDADLTDSPDVLEAMMRYLNDFDAARKAATNADELEQAMKQKYPDLGEERFLSLAAKSAFRK